LKPFIDSFNNKPNKLEGLMEGRLVVEKANTRIGGAGMDMDMPASPMD
jgi:hypothetical protein